MSKSARKEKLPSTSPSPTASTSANPKDPSLPVLQQMMQQMVQQQNAMQQMMQQQQRQEERHQEMMNQLIANQVAAGRTAPVVLQPPDKFKGDENPEEVPFRHWAESLQRYAEKSDQDPVALLRKYLAGKALQEFLSIPEENYDNFEAVIEILKDRLQPTKSPVCYAMDLAQMKQESSESVIDFEVRFRQVLNKIEVANRVQHLVNGNFLLALKPAIRERIISKVTDHQLETAELIQKAIQIERDYEVVKNLNSGDNRSKFYQSRKQNHNEKAKTAPGTSEKRPVSRHHLFCSHCKISGHSNEICFKLHPEMRYFSKRREAAKQNLIKSCPQEPVKVNGIKMNALLDTAAELSMISREKATEVGGERRKPERVLIGANGGKVDIESVLECEVELEGQKQNCDFYVQKGRGFGSDALLGWNNLQQFGIGLVGPSGTHLGVGCNPDEDKSDIPSTQNEDIFTCSPDDFLLPNNRNIDAQILLNEVADRLECLTIDDKKLEDFDLQFDSALTEKERSKLTKFINGNRSLFASKFSDLKGGAFGIEHSISLLPGTKPTKQKPRFLGPRERQIEIEEVDKMLANGIIRESHSPWSSPIVLVKKSDGSTRFCIDYRKLNSVTVTDAHPLPNIGQMWGHLSGSKFFSSLDLFSGYWQIPMAADSVEMTAFATSRGLYEFVVMPFGLTNAPATFQRFMTDVISDLKDEDGNPFCQVYLDDILVYSKTFEDHLLHLKLLFEKLKERNLFLKFKKCTFAQQQLTYLGMKITPKGILPDPEKVSIVEKYPPPSNIQTLRSFLGFTSYFRQFIPKYASTAVPLFALLKKNAKWKWSEAEDTAFEKIKEALMKATLLHFPQFDEDAKFLLETDASGLGLGCVLSQVFAEKTVPLYFFSRSLRKPEINYSPMNQEMLAVIWGLKKASKIVPVECITVMTDHKPLLAAMTVWQSNPPNARIERWMQYLSGKEVEIKYRKGSDNKAADFLSRINMLKILPNIPQISPTVLLSAQISDPELIDFEETNPGSVKIVDGIRYKDENGELLLIVPEKFRNDLVKNEHEMAHFSPERTFEALNRKYWWPEMRKIVLSAASLCTPCSERNSAKSEKVLNPGTVIGKFPMEIVAADVLQLPLSHNGNRYILVVIDSFSRFPFAFAMPDQTGSRIAELLSSNVFSVFGPAVNLLTDRGRNFGSRAVEAILGHFGIKHLKTTPAYPQGNGQAERLCRTLIDSLAKKCFDYRHWDKELTDVLTAYRNQPNKMTGKTPHEVIFGLKENCATEISEPDHADSIVTDGKFKDGDVVMRYDRIQKQGRGWKLQRYWTGPFRITKLKTHTAEIQNLKSLKKLVVNRSQLKHCSTQTAKLDQPFSTANHETCSGRMSSCDF